MSAREFWRPIINDFNPVGRVRPEDNERFFVDRSEASPTRSMVQRLKLNLQNSVEEPTPYKALLTGHVGSGKSSELLRLGQELADDFFVVSFDAELSLATETANHFDVLLGMGIVVYAAAEATGLNPNKKLGTDFVSSFSKFVRQYEERGKFTLKLDKLIQQVSAFVFVAGAVASAPIAIAVGALAFGVNEVIKATRLELNVDDKLVRTLELPANRQEIIGKLNAILDDVRRKAGKPLLIITDGLDKVSAERAQLLFADSVLLTEPAAALIYAAPIEFYHRLLAKLVDARFADYRMLINPPVHQRPLTGDDWRDERKADEGGISVMQSIVAKRLTARGLAVGDVITAEALRLLVRMSGGVVRELIRSFREAAISAQLLRKSQIDERLARDVIEQQRQEMAPRLNVSHREALKKVLQQAALSGGEQRGVEDELLRSLHLLSYQRGDFWFDAHPYALTLL